MCAGVDGTVLAIAGETVEVLTPSGRRTCLWTAPEMPRVGDRVLTFANLGLGVIPDESIEPKQMEDA